MESETASGKSLLCFGVCFPGMSFVGSKTILEDGRMHVELRRVYKEIEIQYGYARSSDLWKELEQ